MEISNIETDLYQQTTHLMWIAVPAVFHVPEPWLVPQHVQAECKAVRVVDEAPRVLAEFD